MGRVLGAHVLLCHLRIYLYSDFWLSECWGENEQTEPSVLNV